MADQQSYADVTINGKEVEEAISVVAKEREVRGVVMTMKGPITFRKKFAHFIVLEVGVMDDGSEPVWDDVSDGTMSVEPEGGKATDNYRGVYCKTVGEKKNDSENGTVRTVEFVAKSKA